MKRKIIAVVLVLCLTTAVITPSSQAAGSVCFTAINNMLNPLDYSTMPAIIGSLLYIPSAFFSSDDLGVKSFVNGNQIFIYNFQKGLLFDIDQSIVVDQNYNKLNIPAIKQNGLIYIPVDEVSKFFGLTYDVISGIDPAPVVRFINAQDAYSRNTFIEVNRLRMQMYYNAYVGSGTKPGTTPAVPSMAPTYENVSVYLSFYNLAAKDCESILNTLDLYRFKACFFVSADEIADDASLLRRAEGSGHTIGIWLREGTFDEYQRVSSLLFEAAKIRSVVVSAPNDAEGTTKTTASLNGLVYWKPTRTYDGTDGLSFDGLTSDLSVLYGNRESLNFNCSDDSMPTIINFFNYLSLKRYTVQRITENTTPVSSAY